MERQKIVDSEEFLAINTTDTTNHLFNYTFSSAYLDGTVHLRANHEAVSCEMISYDSIDGKPAISNW